MNARPEAVAGAWAGGRRRGGGGGTSRARLCTRGAHGARWARCAPPRGRRPRSPCRCRGQLAVTLGGARRTPKRSGGPSGALRAPQQRISARGRPKPPKRTKSHRVPFTAEGRLGGTCGPRHGLQRPNWAHLTHLTRHLGAAVVHALRAHFCAERLRCQTARFSGWRGGEPAAGRGLRLRPRRSLGQ